VEFVVIDFFESLVAVVAFAGQDYATAICEFHYEVRLELCQ
jgi:hypothetical protein